MNTCKYEPCSNEPKGSSAYCSDSCRAQHSRRNKSSATLEAQQLKDDGFVETPGAVGYYTKDVTAADQSCIVQVKTIVADGSGDIATLTPRTNPDSLNYGKYMNSDQLKQAGLTANRVPIPGDSDYKGVCVKVDGVWQVAA